MYGELYDYLTDDFEWNWIRNYYTISIDCFAWNEI